LTRGRGAGPGIVRPARRPRGWRAPGPAPRPPRNALALGPRPGEDLCYLAGDWRILQRIDGHRWSLDDLVTAWFAASRVGAPPRRGVDLGCGIGAVLLLVAWRFPRVRLIGVEAQAVSVDLARRSLAWNGLAGRCEVRQGDLRDPAVLSEGPCFDLVTATPPYRRPGTATRSARIQRAACHFEERGGIEAYCVAAARLLAPGGRFVTCAAGADTARVERAATTVGLRTERRLAVVPRAGKPVLLVVHALARAAEVDRTTDERPLVVRDRRGRRTRAFTALRAGMGMPP
jgi:tRNA1(Val) A37 N6-methylase TrmN6